MRLLFIFLLMLCSLHATADDARPHAESYCKDYWTKAGVLNSEMYQYCVKQELEGFAGAEAFRKEHQNDAWFKQTVESGCENKWTKSGVKQNSMVLYCYKEELSGYKELKYQASTPQFNKDQAEACFEKWHAHAGDAFNMTAYCYKNKSENPVPNHPPALITLLADTSPNKSPNVESLPQAKQAVSGTDTELVGFDLALEPSDFLKKYRDKIQSCKADKYQRNEISEKFSVPTYECEFKEKNGFIKFYAHQGHYEVFKFTHKFPQDGVKMRVAANKLEEKVGKKSELADYSNDFFTFCGANVPFMGGQAAVISKNILGELINKRQRGVAQTNCSADIFINVDADVIQFDNPNLVKVMDDAIIHLRVLDEDKKGKDLHL